MQSFSKNQTKRNSEKQQSSPKVAIVVLNWNGVNKAIECVEQIRRIDYPNYEIIVVDNGSKGDDVKILIEKYGNSIPVIANKENYGLSKGRNAGIMRALNRDAEYVQILDNDVLVAPDFLTQLVNVVQGEPTIGIAGPIIYHYEEPNKIAYAGRYINYWTGFIKTRGKDEIDNGQYKDVVDMDCATGGTMLITRNALQKVGLLDERFFFWFEDMDYCTRAVKARLRVVLVPMAKVWVKDIKKDKESRESQTDEKTTIFGYYFIRNRFLLMKKHCSSPQMLTSTICFIIFDASHLLMKYLSRYHSWPMLKYSIKGLFNILFRRELQNDKNHH
jgi:GT2 family glycosyltransferase